MILSNYIDGCHYRLWFQCLDLRNFTDGEREWHLSRLGKFISHRWWEARPESSPIPPTPLCFPLWHLTLSQWHYCVAAFSSRIVLLLCVSFSSVRITSFLHKRPSKPKAVKDISCIHALTVGSERSLSWALLREMGRGEEEEKQGGKLQPWNQAGTFQSWDGGCQWPLLLPFGWVQIWTSLPGLLRDGCGVMVYCRGIAVRLRAALPPHSYIPVTRDCSPFSFHSFLQGKWWLWQDPCRPLITVPMFKHPICPRLFPSNLCWFS